MNDEQNTVVPIEEAPNAQPLAVIPSTSPVVKKPDGNISVTALVPEQMSSCQSALVAWCQQKIADVRGEAVELRGAFEQAKAKKWKTSVLRRHALLAEKRVVFYEKMLAALEHGFIIVPNFPVGMFAVRKEGSPDRRYLGYVKVGYSRPKHEQIPDNLPEGEGEYQNPYPYVYDFGRTKDEHGNEIVATAPNAWKELDFPVAMAKPEIMEAADRAMALKIFDQLGILPAEVIRTGRATRDPIIVGQLVDPRSTTYNKKVVTFMIAWHLDTRAL